ncbi:MAG: inositol monophosphatase [Propionicimonas sp.]|uniref:inositol monophosphatase family protein n=1 Tax=Propionicimonas sp. TaxID=1955623 RepID=UPI002B20CF26|nr:inositol monophosphatase [Propionicimonas sp.]MEA4945043.1 inositol monophosphatase [Propionicimonas sp.]MEA5052700.1 inositol monophosphatase [Propionicimonas sp.]MEA5119371.1 inositol monophosphatase [Propionicimonas sp.]
MQTEWVSERIREVADRVILPRFGALAEGEIEEKKPGDLVTIADRDAERELVKILATADPGALLVGEEGVFTDPARLDALPGAERAWVIDPVDGTKNFSRGSKDFAVMVAEVRTGVAVRGWIWQPMHGRMYQVERGAGVTCNDEPLQPRPSGREVPLGATYVPMTGEGAAVQVRRSWGCCGVDYPNLIAGEVDFLTYRSMFPWDHLPGGLMVQELGGRIATSAGEDYRPGVMGRRLIAAMKPAVWETAREAIAGC